jgi:hypothetical protein
VVHDSVCVNVWHHSTALCVKLRVTDRAVLHANRHRRSPCIGAPSLDSVSRTCLPFADWDFSQSGFDEICMLGCNEWCDCVYARSHVVDMSDSAKCGMGDRHYQPVMDVPARLR